MFQKLETLKLVLVILNKELAILIKIEIKKLFRDRGLFDTKMILEIM